MAIDGDQQPAAGGDDCRISSVEFDAGTLPAGGGNCDYERAVAAADLAETAILALADGPPGPYQLRLSVVGDRLILTFCDEASRRSLAVPIAMRPLRQVIRDYRILCDSYLAAVRSAPFSRIAEIDRERRDTHDQGAGQLIDDTAGLLRMPRETARKLFTLVSLIGR